MSLAYLSPTAAFAAESECGDPITKIENGEERFIWSPCDPENFKPATQEELEDTDKLYFMKISERVNREGEKQESKLAKMQRIYGDGYECSYDRKFGEFLGPYIREPSGPSFYTPNMLDTREGGSGPRPYTPGGVTCREIAPYPYFLLP